MPLKSVMSRKQRKICTQKNHQMHVQNMEKIFYNKLIFGAIYFKVARELFKADDQNDMRQTENVNL